MLCPACHEEYEPQVSLCPYCGALSPAGAPAAEGPRGEEELGPLVLLHEARSAEALSRLTAALEAGGIPFFVQPPASFHSLGVSGLLRGEGGVWERQEILVPESLLAEAAALLDGLETTK